MVFDLFPITHDSDAFTHTHSNQYLLINIIGQVLIMGGIFSNNLTLMFEMVTVGLVLLTWGLISIAWPSWKLHIESKQKGNQLRQHCINTRSVDTCIFSCCSWMLDFPQGDWSA